MSNAPALMLYDPATGDATPFPSEATQWRVYHGPMAWLFNPWTGDRRDAGDVGSDPFGQLIVPPGELPLAASITLPPAAVDVLQTTLRSMKLGELPMRLEADEAHNPCKSNEVFKGPAQQEMTDPLVSTWQDVQIEPEDQVIELFVEDPEETVQDIITEQAAPEVYKDLKNEMQRVIVEVKNKLGINVARRIMREYGDSEKLYGIQPKHYQAILDRANLALRGGFETL